jgi:hypothetical protein
MTYNLTKPNQTAIRVPDLVSSSRDFGVEQFFRADDFRADDPSPPLLSVNLDPGGGCKKKGKINLGIFFCSEQI